MAGKVGTLFGLGVVVAGKRTRLARLVTLPGTILGCSCGTEEEGKELKSALAARVAG